jgi:hypothetical protein
MYDSSIATALKSEKGSMTTAQKSALLKIKSWIIPEEEAGGHYSLEQGNKVVTFERPQFQRQTVSAAKLGDIVFPKFTDCKTRKVFVTCVLECDVPFIKDKIDRRSFYSNARLVAQEIVDKNEKIDATAVFRINSIMPNPDFVIRVGLEHAQGEEGELNGTIIRTGALNGLEATLGSKLVDANVLAGSSRTDANIIIDDSSTLDQVLSRMLDHRPIYEQNLDANLGKLDTSFRVGDRIDRVVRSELEDGTGGFYNMDLVIDKYTIEASGQSDSFETKITALNTLPILSVVIGRKLGRR